MTDQSGYTQVPNAVIEAMPKMKEAELRVVLAIARKTYGWQKECDVISVTQLVKMTGMTRQGVQNGIDKALEHKVIAREGAKRGGFCYRISTEPFNLVEQSDYSTEVTSQPSRTDLFNEVEQSLFNEVETQKKESKEKKKRDVATPRKRGSRPPKDDTTPADVREALADVCGLELGICSKEQTLQVNTHAKRIYADGTKHSKTTAEIADAIRYVARWYARNDWRGKKGEIPSPKAIVDSWRAAMNDRQPATNGHAPVVKIEKSVQRDSVRALAEAVRKRLESQQ